MKKFVSLLALPLFLLQVASAPTKAQTVKSMVVEDGGTGPFKAEIVADASLPAFTIYRPQDLESCGTLPIVLYGNGACMNSSVEIRYFLNELASHGYLAVAIGPYNEDDFIAHWTSVMRNMHPSGKEVVLADGTVVHAMTDAEREAEWKAAEKSRKKSEKSGKQSAEPFRTYPRQLLEALDWLTDRNADPSSEYYRRLDLSNVAVMGQSCGGAQALAIAHDLRITTAVILNSGIGDMSMQGASGTVLNSIHTPILYIVGGPEDMATANAAKDFARIENVPVFLIDTAVDGHEGSYYEAHGGAYAIAVRKWFDWQLKGKIGQSALFLDNSYFQTLFPSWSLIRKHCGIYGE